MGKYSPDEMRLARYFFKRKRHSVLSCVFERLRVFTRDNGKYYQRSKPWLRFERFFVFYSPNETDVAMIKQKEAIEFFITKRKEWKIANTGTVSLHERRSFI